MSRPRALITGISGQDGSYLAELLLDQGYEVHGLVHGGRLGLAEHLSERVTTHTGDIRRSQDLRDIIAATAPAEIYHFAAVTRPGKSWDQPVDTFEIVALGTVALLDAVLQEVPDARTFLAGSAEAFGVPDVVPQDERTPFSPRNPYGAAKAAAVSAARAYRNGRGLFVSTGLFFNHESPRRPRDFVTRKITWHAAAIARGQAETLHLGNVEAERDWGYAPDYVDGAWRALQADAPDDYVFATGVLHRVMDVVDIAFSRAGVETEGRVVVDPEFFRAEEGPPLVGNAAKARDALGWEPRTDFESMITEMVDADLAAMVA